MKVGEKVVFNTVVLYSRVIITMLISLVSVPIILKALGASDYGLYNLVAGVILMLTFLNASMHVVTQRYLSVAMGKGDLRHLNSVFNVAILLHLIIGGTIVILFEVCGLFLFDGFLNIEPDRIPAAKIIYQTLIVSTFFSIVSVPYGALINSKEEMLILSINHIIKDVLKLLLALYLSHTSADRLILYGMGVAMISIIYTLISRTVVKVRYKEFVFKPRTYYDKDVFKSMFSFAGWNTFGALATIGRNQGISIVFNLFYGTIINAAYGVANQVNSVLSGMTATFSHSINPQLMKSKGMENQGRLERISMISSKYAFTMFSLFSMPLIIEMSKVLKLWLGNPPEYTLILAQLVIILSMVHLFSNGLMSAIQAAGKIAGYQITMSILILLNIPFSYIILKLGYSPYYCIGCFIVIECISLVVRLIFAHILAGISAGKFVKKVILPTTTTVIVSSIIPLILHFTFNESLGRVIVVSIAYVLVYIPMVWFFVIEKSEKPMFLNMLNKLFSRKKKNKRNK